MLVAVYCRYSSDRQRETSIADQLRVCQTFADQRGWSLVAMHSDEEVSGSTPVRARRGGAALLADAMADRFGALVLEGLDRLSRDLVEQETIVRRLEHRGIRIIGVCDGYDSEATGKKLHRGMRGLINEVYLDDLRAKTHRGQAGQVSRGYSAGGGGYGYRSTHDGTGYRIEIDEDQARWVRWIFEHFAEGWSSKRIVAELNRLRVPSPRGGTWAVSAVYGSAAKGCGILHNELYVGRYIWNRSQWVKDPDTGKRQRFERPRSEWLIEERSALRIIDQAIWDATRARFSTSYKEGGTKGKGRAPRSLLGGLMKCGYCGGAVVAINGKLYGCATKHDRGAVVCRGVFAPRQETETRILAGVREELLRPSAIAEMQQMVTEMLRAELAVGESEAKAARGRVVELEREIDRLVEAIASVGISDALTQRLRNAEAELASVRRTAATSSGKKVEIPNLKSIYREQVMNLQEALRSDIQQARNALREMIGPITVVERNDEVWAQIDTGPEAMLKASGLYIGLVAGACFGSNIREIRIS